MSFEVGDSRIFLFDLPCSNLYHTEISYEEHWWFQIYWIRRDFENSKFIRRNFKKIWVGIYENVDYCKLNFQKKCKHYNSYIYMVVWGAESKYKIQFYEKCVFEKVWCDFLEIYFQKPTLISLKKLYLYEYLC